MSLLYEAETKGQAPAEVLASLPVAPDEFATALVAGAGEHMAELDDWITRYARDWTIERMPALDRALLRIGIFELLYRPDVPTGALISEAVELAQRFSTDESSRFVNGMLARIAEAVRPGTTVLQAEAVDAEAVDPDAAEDDHALPGKVVEDGLHQ